MIYMHIFRKGDLKMKPRSLCSLVLSAIAITSLVAGCQKKKQDTQSSSESQPSSSEVDPSSSSEQSSSEPAENVILSAVTQKDEFTMFLSNREKPSSEDSGFINRTNNYQVGDDNAFNVKPELTVLDSVTLQPVASSEWKHDFKITMTIDGEETPADETYFTIEDARNADVKFAEKAIGHEFTISVVPTNISESKVEQWTKKFTVEVVDGYNVYNAKELGYFDTRHGEAEPDGTNGDVAGIKCQWDAFKTENGMDPTYEPKALLFHNNIELTVDDFPSNYIYTKAEATAASDAKAEGTLKDRINLYTRTSSQDVTLNGNYFGLDISKIPLIVREEGQTTAVGGVVSHAAVFKANNANMTLTNLNITGNAKRATSDEDTIYGGGLILTKGGTTAVSIKSDNIIARDTFITFMSEKPTDGYPTMLLDIEDTKCSNNYNSFIYNWAGKVYAHNSSFVNCGGPIIIQDHRDASETYEANHGLQVLGQTPETTFENCVLNNFVGGSEAWFIQFGATALMPQIKSMSDLYAVSTGKSFIVNEAREGKIYQELAAGGKASFFNFIALNKSASIEGMTNAPVCGQVTIKNSTENTTFDYRQPANDPVCKAYLAYAAAPSEETATALAVAAITAGLPVAQDLSNLEEVVSQHVTAVCTRHEILRGLNNNGAPVFDLAGDTPLGTTDGSTPNMLDAAALAQSSLVNYSLTSEQAETLPSATALYYNGMMLLMGLYDLVA